MKRKLLLLSLATAGCAAGLALTFVVSRFALVGLLVLVPLLYLLNRSNGLSRKQFLRQCYLFGLVYFGIVMAWIYNIRATDLIADTVFANLFKLLTFVIIMSMLGVGFVLAGWLYRRLQLQLGHKSSLLIPAIWIVGEFFRSVFFSVISHGPGGSIGPYWNFGSLGLAVAGTPLGYASRLVGMYGLSFLVVLIAVVVFHLLRRRYRYAIILLLPVGLSLLGYSLYRQPSGKTINVSTVGLNASVEEGQQARLRDKLVTTQPVDLTVLPEYSYFFADSSGNATKQSLPETSGLIIDSRGGTNAQNNANLTTFYKPDGTIVYDQPKSFLIPAGEFVPYVFETILVASGNTDILRTVENQRSVAQAPVREKPYVYKAVSYGALACSGAIAPTLYKSLANDGAEVLVNSASIASLGVSDLYYHQADQMAAFIATANARPFVQSARGGPSYILDSNGQRLQSTSEPADITVLQSAISTNQTKTVYTRFGEIVLMVSLSAIVLRAAQLIKLSKNSRKPSQRETKPSK